MYSLNFPTVVDVLVSTGKGLGVLKNQQFKVILNELMVGVRIRMGRWVVMIRRSPAAVSILCTTGNTQSRCIRFSKAYAARLGNTYFC